MGEKPVDPITFNVYPDEKGSASVTLYEDDGMSPRYKQDGWRRTSISVAQIAGGYSATINTPEGRYDPGKRKFNFVIKSDKRTPNVATMVDDGGARRIKID